ncbi:TetR/AcrR family transcriptional regulator [Rhodococcus sp. (in: high G+C Gram-positive bacteria)]|uniref:TetR/AcrR family transcriptional regulator n=1 Tax=Rhodococcus sp. TaxID=1831 RepID=UPI00388F5257
MGRPRLHDLDELLDHARHLWVRRGTPGVTIRALSDVSGASNGAIYNAFGSRDGLLASVWAREATRFLEFQRDIADRALTASGPTEAIVAAALAPATYAERDDLGAQLLLAVTLDDLGTPDLAESQRDRLAGLRRTLTSLLTVLAIEQWGRKDATALTLVKYCVVDLPGALLLGSGNVSDPLARHALALAVRGIVSESPPAPDR